ncbi:MAG: aminotransferase class V-fold PLP-dependent enzyme, partial [Bdellovibrionales bacterium]|nr:aminotransferase class V-fold PLP-dependent enzyme [Bdellovibrionales bacterium]
MINDFKKAFFQKDFGPIHLNNCGLAPISMPARDKIRYWADRFYEEGFYTDHDYMNDVLHSRKSLATLIGCDHSEIAFFQSTASAVSQVAMNFPLLAGDEVLMWAEEYGSHLFPWQEACKR